MKGLPNLGNTCYLNFILQILFNTPGFSEEFNKNYKMDFSSLPLDPQKGRHPLFPVASGLGALMEIYHDPEIDTSNIRYALSGFVDLFHKCHTKFGYGQQDGHEYLTFLFRAIHDTMYNKTYIEVTRPKHLSSYDKLELAAIEAHRIDGSSTTELMLNRGNSYLATCYNSVVFQMFSGQYLFQTQCRNPECGYVSNRFETFRCCEVPIGNPDKKDINLHDVLREYTSVTELEDKYECDKCKVKTNSYRRCTFWRLPEVLILQLKRGVHHFDRESGNYYELKDERAVEIPDTLDMNSEYCSSARSRTKYSLYATGNHYGKTHGGHYYAQIKDNGKWYVVNDEQINEGNGPLQHVCLLFYRLN